MWNVRFCLCGVLTSPTQTYCSSLDLLCDLSFPHVYFKSLCFDNWTHRQLTMSIWHIRPRWTNIQECALPPPSNILVIFSLCSAVQPMRAPCLMWKGWSTKHLRVLKSSVRLISKLSLITKAACWNHRAWGIEVTSTATSKTNGICRSYGYCLPCRCAASNALWRSQKATELHRGDLMRCYLSQIWSTCWGLRQ